MLHPNHQLMFKHERATAQPKAPNAPTHQAPKGDVLLEAVASPMLEDVHGRAVLGFRSRRTRCESRESLLVSHVSWWGATILDTLMGADGP